jgi:Flp pilus assembly protein TadD
MGRSNPPSFGRAAELEPNDPVHWNDLADAFEAVGEDEAAADARARAEELTSD